MDTDDYSSRPKKNYCEKKQKLNNGRSKIRIRKLVDSEKNENGQQQYTKIKFSILTIVFISVMIAVYTNKNLQHDLFEHYKRQYNLLLYGIEDYCYQNFKFENITEMLRKKLVGQTKAIDHLAQVLHDHKDEQYSSIAIYGSVGVGKSYAGKIIAQEYQWPKNVHNFLWDYGKNGDENFSHFLNFLFNIRQNMNTKCGHNIIFIDNLSVKEAISMNKIAEKVKLASSNDNIKIMLVFIVSISNYSDVRLNYEDKMNVFMSNLSKNIKLISFMELTDEDLKGCVKLEATDLGITLNETQLDDVISCIDVKKSGCKSVAAKVKIYGTLS